MAAPVSNIEVNQGATFTIQFTLKNATTTNPINITDYEFCGAVKQTHYDDEIFEFRFVIIDAVNGVGQAILDPAVTERIDFNKGVYDLSYKLTDGSVTRFLMGDVTISLGGTAPC